MPRRNEKLGPNQAYSVRKANGKCYTVYSAKVLNARIENGKITPDDKIQLKVIGNS